MSAARDVIARALEFEFGIVAVEVADTVLSDLHAAGYRIVGPGEVDRETLEKAAQVALTVREDERRCAKQAEGDGDSAKMLEHMGFAGTALIIVAAIRSLGGKDA